MHGLISLWCCCSWNIVINALSSTVNERVYSSPKPCVFLLLKPGESATENRKEYNIIVNELNISYDVLGTPPTRQYQALLVGTEGGGTAVILTSQQQCSRGCLIKWMVQNG